MRAFVRNFHAILWGACLLGATTGLGQTPGSTAKPEASPTAASEADKAWDALVQLGQPPRPPEAWQTKPPSEEELEKFRASEATRLIKAADAAKDFAVRYPTHVNVSEARSKEYELLETSAALGNTNVFPRLEAIDEAKLKDPKTPEDERYRIRVSAVDRKARSRVAEGMAEAMVELEKGARSLLKEFPSRTDAYQMLLAVASRSEGAKARELAKEISDSSAPEPVKAEAKGILEKMERVGKPLAIKFAAVDGRPVDLQTLRGKVVLIDFWATWCGPCVQEIPNVRATYTTLHPKGFEIVGISFDREKDKLLSFVEQQKMPWPQYFDGKQWENEYGKQFGIESIPTMWLVDRKGNLRDVNAREDLAKKVEKLLAEAP